MDYTEKVNQQIKLQSGMMLGFAEYGDCGWCTGDSLSWVQRLAI